MLIKIQKYKSEIKDTFEQVKNIQWCYDEEVHNLEGAWNVLLGKMSIVL